jgi:hypothetical protein
MTAWNFNMGEAPRGRFETVTRKTPKGTETQVQRHFPDLILAAGNNRVVTASRWLPDEGRWNMFTKECPPIAWMPWPTHPEAAQ